MLKKISAALTIVFLSSVTFSAVGEVDMRQAVITELKNNVELKYGQSLWREARAEQLVRPGTSIRTGSLSKVEIKYPDGTITRIGGRTTLTVLDRSIRAVKIDSGKIWFKVAKKSAGYRIYSPTAVAAITGTEGFVEYGDTEKVGSKNNMYASASKDFKIAEDMSGGYQAGLVEGSMNIYKGSDETGNLVGDPTQVNAGQVLSMLGNNFQLQNVGTDQIFNQHRDISTPDNVANNNGSNGNNSNGQNSNNGNGNSGNVQNQNLGPTNVTTEQVPASLNKQQDITNSPTTGDLEIIIK